MEQPSNLGEGEYSFTPTTHCWLHWLDKAGLLELVYMLTWHGTHNIHSQVLESPLTVKPIIWLNRSQYKNKNLNINIKILHSNQRIHKQIIIANLTRVYSLRVINWCVEWRHYRDCELQLYKQAFSLAVLVPAHPYLLTWYLCRFCNNWLRVLTIIASSFLV